MKKVFIGLLFLFLYIRINGLDILPVFVGYILVAHGLKEKGEYPSVKTTRTISVVAAVITGLLWALEIVGVGIPLPIGALFQLLVTYRLILWVEELAGEGIRVAAFRRSWYVLLAGVLVSLLLGLLGNELSIVALLIGLAAAACYVYTYYRMWKELEQE